MGLLLLASASYGLVVLDLGMKMYQEEVAMMLTEGALH
jgi:hypothetical protein